MLVSNWKNQINLALSNDELPNHIAYGILDIKQKGLIAFRRENPWVEQAIFLPYTALLLNGQFQEGFMGQKLDELHRLLSDSPS